MSCKLTFTGKLIRIHVQDDDIEFFAKLTNPDLHGQYDELSELVQAVN